MDDLRFLFAAYTVVWVALFGYLIFLSIQIRHLREELWLLRQALEERQGRREP